MNDTYVPITPSLPPHLRGETRRPFFFPAHRKRKLGSLGHEIDFVFGFRRVRALAKLISICNWNVSIIHEFLYYK